MTGVLPAVHALASGPLASSPLSGETYIGAGLVGLFLVLFAETGLLIGFFLPGDTLLLLAGFHTKTGASDHLNYLTTAIVCVVAAFVGAQTGFLIGRASGPRLFASPQRAEGVERARRLLDRFGGAKALVVARFIPLVRTFMNPAVGITGMPAARFTVANLVGAVIWPPLILFLGRLLPQRYESAVDKVIILVVILGLAVPVVEQIRRRRARS